MRFHIFCNTFKYDLRFIKENQKVPIYISKKFDIIDII